MSIWWNIMTRVLLVVLALMPAFLPATAWSHRDHDDAWQALATGQILPLPQVLQQVTLFYPGQVLEVELEQEASGWIYEVKVLQSGGRLVKVVIDARNAKVLGTARGSRHHHRPRREEP